MPEFVRKERDHLDVLKRRLDHLNVNVPERRGDPNYMPGEAGALSWALKVIEGTVEPVEVRMQRFEEGLRKISSRLGRVEHDLEVVDE